MVKGENMLLDVFTFLSSLDCLAWFYLLTAMLLFAPSRSVDYCLVLFNKMLLLVLYTVQYDNGSTSESIRGDSETS